MGNPSDMRATAFEARQSGKAGAPEKPDLIYICTRHPLAFNVIRQAVLADTGKQRVIKPWSNAILVSEVSRRDILVLDTCSVERWPDIMLDCKEMSIRPLLLIPADDQDRLKCLQALRNGAEGIVAMSADLNVQLPKALRAVADGHLWISRGVLEDYVKQANPLLHQIALEHDFTAREEQIIPLLRKGLSNRQIGSMCGISERTVKFHVSNILRKSEIASRRELLPQVETGPPKRRPAPAESRPRTTHLTG